MAQPETGPSTSSGRIPAGADLWAGRERGGFRLPASGLAVSCLWGSDSKVLGAMSGRLVAVAVVVFALVPSRGGRGTGNVRWRGPEPPTLCTPVGPALCEAESFMSVPPHPRVRRPGGMT